MSDDLLELNVLPLGEVVLPGQRRRLRVSETRNRQLIRRCFEWHESCGVMLSSFATQGHVRPLHSSIATVGTVVRVLSAEWDATGDLAVDLLGISRFRLLAAASPPFSAEIEKVQHLDESQGDAGQCRHFAAKAVSAFVEYVSLLLALTNRPASELTFPTDLCALSYAIAASLWTGEYERQRLLAASSAEDRLRLELAILERERGLLAAKMPRRPDVFGLCRATPLN